MLAMSGLLTTNIMSQLLSARCKEWFSVMKINSTQITPAAGVNIQCLITADATVVSTAAFKTCLCIGPITRGELK